MSNRTATASTALIVIAIGGIISVLIGQSTERLSTTGTFWRPQLRWAPSHEARGAEVDQSLTSFAAIVPRTFGDWLHLWSVQSHIRNTSAMQEGNDNGRCTAIADLNSLCKLSKSEQKSFPIRKFRSTWIIQRAQKDSVFDGEGHVDQLLVALAQGGVGLYERITTPDGPVSVFELVESSRKLYVRGQEPYWSLIAYCAYASSLPEWKNRFGEIHSIEQMVCDIISDNGISTCNDSHKYESLAIVLQLDEQHQVLTIDTRRDVVDFLREACLRLQASQRSNGALRLPLAGAATNSGADLGGGVLENNLVFIASTAHHLEWIMLLPREMRPESACLNDAVRFLSRAVSFFGPKDMAEHYCTFSHAVGVLACVADPARERVVLTGVAPVSQSE